MMPCDVHEDEHIRNVLKRRMELLKNNGVPTQTELLENLGSDLGNIVLENMSPIARELMIVDNPPQVNEQNVIEEANALNDEEIFERGKNLELDSSEETFRPKCEKEMQELCEFEQFDTKKQIRFAVEFERNLQQKKFDELKAFFKKELSKKEEELHKFYNEKYSKRISNKLDSEFSEPQDENNKPKSSINVEENVNTRLNFDGGTSSNSSQDNRESQKQQNHKILQNLWSDFKEHLRIQRHSIICEHVTEILHLICAQKQQEQKRIAKIHQENREKLEEMSNKFRELLKEKTCLKSEEIEQLFSVENNGLTEIENENNADGTEFKCLFLCPEKENGEDRFCRCCPASSSSETLTEQTQKSILKPEIECSNKNLHFGVQISWSPSSSSLSSSSMVNVKKLSVDKSSSSKTIDFDQISPKSIEESPASILAERIIEDIEFEELSENFMEQITPILHNIEIAKQVYFENIQERVKNVLRKKLKETLNCNNFMSFIKQAKRKSILAAADSLEITKAKFCKMKETSTGSSSNRTSITGSLPENSSISGSIDKRSSDFKLFEQAKNSYETVYQRNILEHVLQRRKTEELLKINNNNEEINESIKKEEKIDHDDYMKSFIKIPKYMFPPDSKVESNWIYRETTDEEWQQLMKAIDERDNQDLRKCDIQLTKKESELPQDINDGLEQSNDDNNLNFGKLRILSIINLLENNEEIRELIEKRRRWK